MKKLATLLLLTLSVSLAGSQAKAQDGFFSNARTLAKGTGSIAIQPVFLTEQDDFMMMFRGAYGLNHGLTGHFKLGAFDDDVYVGAHLEANIADESQSGISIAAISGIYSQNELGLKAGLNFSKNFHPVSFYTGLNYQPLFLDGNTLNALLIPVGVDIHLKEESRFDLIFEGDISVNDDAEYLQSLTFGARFYLN
jgi:hypothetical protein